MQFNGFIIKCIPTTTGNSVFLEMLRSLYFTLNHHLTVLPFLKYGISTSSVNHVVFRTINIILTLLTFNSSMASWSIALKYKKKSYRGLLPRYTTLTCKSFYIYSKYVQ